MEMSEPVEPDEEFNAGDKASVRRKKMASERLARERKALLESIMQFQQGRRWIKELLVACHCFQTSFSKNALEMAFAEGQRNIGLQLLADITASCPEQYVTMLQEKYDE